MSVYSLNTIKLKEKLYLEAALKNKEKIKQFINK